VHGNDLTFVSGHDKFSPRDLLRSTRPTEPALVRVRGCRPGAASRPGGSRPAGKSRSPCCKVAGIHGTCFSHSARAMMGFDGGPEDNPCSFSGLDLERKLYSL
jgi:hypothetical protein